MPHSYTVLCCLCTGLFELQPLGGPMIAMKNIQTQRYVAISNRGRVYTVVSIHQMGCDTAFASQLYTRLSNLCSRNCLHFA